MRFLKFGAVAVLGLLFWSTCSDNPVNDPAEVPSFTIDQLAQFDTTGYLMISRSGYDQVEPFLTTEKMIGEPFTDVNGNGVYDEGVDEFVYSTDPKTNQDLNHNGRYDGPDEPWSPGTPFDDIDGNGLPRERYDPYLPGTPFMDLNGNGKRDGEPYTTNVCKTEIGTADSTGTYYDYYYSDSTHTFLSDSLIRYYLSTNYFSPGSHIKVGIGGYHRNHDTLYFGVFPILCGDTIQADSVLDSVPGITYIRKTTMDTTFTFFDIRETGLVRVHLEVVESDNLAFYKEFGDFYFSPTRGPVGYLFRQGWFWQPQYVFFGAKIDSLPLPMVQ